MATPKAKLRPVHESSQGQRPLSRKSNVPLPTGMKSPDQHVSLEDSEPPASGQLDNEPKSAARLMGPPPLPLSKQHQQRPHPAALTPDSQHDNRDTANGQHDFEYGHVIENEHAYMDNPHDQVDDVHLDEGNAQSAPFDWHEIQQRYHNALENQTMIENDAWSEFCKLLDFFGIWAGVSTTHEVETGKSRSHEQIAHVQTKEAELQQLKDHHVQVVNAFQSAIQLLGPTRA